MNDFSLRILVQTALRDPECWVAFRGQVAEEYLPPMLRVICDSAAELELSTGKLPSRGALLTKVQEFAAATECFDADDLEEVRSIIMDPIEMLTLEEVQQWAFHFVSSMYRNEVISGLAEVPPEEVAGFLEQAAASLTSVRPTSLMTRKDLADQWDTVLSAPSVPLQNTGVDFLNDFIKGFANGRIYSYLGPTGGGKTALSVQVAVGLADTLYKKFVANRRNGRLGLVFYVTTEDGPRDIMIRMLSHAAQIDRDTLSGDVLVPLTTKETLSEADRALKTRYKAVFSETDRLRMATTRLKNNVVIVDMSDEGQMRGLHPADFIQQQINRILATDVNEDGTPKSYCAFIIVDHCEILISRLKMKSKADSWEVAESLPLTMRSKLAQYFNCPGWIVHQLTGKANEKGEGADIHHTEAKGSKSWGTYFDVCLNVTRLTKKDRITRLQITKNRTGPIKEDIYLKLIGNLCTLTKTDKPVGDDKKKGDGEKTTTRGEARKVNKPKEPQ